MSSKTPPTSNTNRARATINDTPQPMTQNRRRLAGADLVLIALVSVNERFRFDTKRSHLFGELDLFVGLRFVGGSLHQCVSIS